MPRHLFSAPAQIIHAGATTQAHCTELSRFGCYFDTDAAVRSGTVVRVKIFGNEYFEADARVVFQHLCELCVVFQKVSPECQQILKRWLESAKEQAANAEPK